MVTKTKGADLASDREAPPTVWEQETERNFDVLRKEIDRRRDVNRIVDTKAAMVQQQIKFDRPDLIPVSNLLAKLFGVGPECRGPAKQKANEFADQFYRRQAESKPRHDVERLRNHVADIEGKLDEATKAIPRLEEDLAAAIMSGELERLPTIRQELANAETTILVTRREIEIANRMTAEAVERRDAEEVKIRHEVLTDFVNVAAEGVVTANRDLAKLIDELPQLREILARWKSAAFLLDYVFQNMYGDNWLNTANMDYMQHE